MVTLNSQEYKAFTSLLTFFVASYANENDVSDQVSVLETTLGYSGFSKYFEYAFDLYDDYFDTSFALELGYRQMCARYHTYGVGHTYTITVLHSNDSHKYFISFVSIKNGKVKHNHAVTSFIDDASYVIDLYEKFNKTSFGILCSTQI